jgi:type VI secretion system protein ImpE
MIVASELFQAGKLSEAIRAVSDELRQKPLDTAKRTFLFELLCFAGEWGRGEMQLDVLAQGGTNAELGAMVYRAVLHAERERQEFFGGKAYLFQGLGWTNRKAEEAAENTISNSLPCTAPAGVFNGRTFHSISDADPRIGARLEIFLAGQYLSVPLEHIASIQVRPPKRLRDLLWAPALITNQPNLQLRDIGEVLIPVLSPFSHTHEDDAVRLGRMTAWKESDGLELPFGQKLLLVDGEEIPFLEIRDLQVNATPELPIGDLANANSRG